MVVYRIAQLLKEWLWSFRRDNCQFCRGTQGGVLGNENWVDGLLMCDYCHAEILERDERE